MASLQGFAAPTSIVYGIAGIPLGRIVPAIAPNNLGLFDNKTFDLSFIYKALNKLLAFSGAADYRKSGVNGYRFTAFVGEGEFSLQSLLILCNYVVMVLFKHVFWCIGLLDLAVIIFLLARLNFGKVSDWKRFCLECRNPPCQHFLSCRLALIVSPNSPPQSSRRQFSPTRARP